MFNVCVAEENLKEEL